MDPVEQFKESIKETTRYIKEKIDTEPQIAMVLGSGLGALADEIEKKKVIPYVDIPNFPIPMAPGHAGNLVIGELEGKNVVAMQGRFHFYEGYTMKGITFPIRVFKSLGANILIVTNAAGGLSRFFKEGDLMVITDQINLMGTNPLIGPTDEELGPRFLDMSQAYDEGLIYLAQQAAKENGIKLKKGVYVGLTGPAFETPAEVRFLTRIGADAVGMSTVPEVIVARHVNFRVLGISCITNLIFKKPTVFPKHETLHEEVLAVAEKSAEKLKKLVRGVLAKL